nr:deoxyribodipyrimidine photo-lyase [Desulfurispira natronophila]
MVWLRSDLRVQDNPALFYAMERGSTVAVYCHCPRQWQQHQVGANQQSFIRRQLASLQDRLIRLNLPLFVLEVPDFSAVPKAIKELATDLKIRQLHFNDEYPVNERRRDQSVSECLQEMGIEVHRYTDRVISTPGSLLTGAGEFYKVFTPFARTWRSRELEQLSLPLPAPTPQSALNISTPPDWLNTPKADTGNHIAQLWPAGEDEAQRRLTQFLDGPVLDYQAQRDYPACDATSRLSPYLAHGVLSVRHCLYHALQKMEQVSGAQQEGVWCWINELIWREFYTHILVGYPRVSMNRAFQQHTEALPWRNDPDGFAAWCEGRTGFPLVDAAMAQLHQTGWMHNRLRMVCAMFLTKNLFIHWRWGEDYFMQHLIDGDLAANNGGWQWAASTGTDAAPYFRMFHPTTQSKRFDPRGKFLRHYLPQLAHLSDQYIHEPWHRRNPVLPKDYPQPIVDHRESRQRVLAAFKKW